MTIESDTITLREPPVASTAIDVIWAFVSVDDLGREGICAMTLPKMPGPMPLIAADEAGLAVMTPFARQLARHANTRIRLIKLSTRSDVMAIGPDGGDVAG